MSITMRGMTALLIGIVIFAGLPLAGWGVRDIQGFIANPARLGYMILAVALQGLIVLRLPEVGRSRGPGKKLVRRQQLAVLLLQVLPLAIVLLAPYGDRRHIAVLSAVGVDPLFWAGSVCRWVS